MLGLGCYEGLSQYQCPFVRNWARGYDQEAHASIFRPTPASHQGLVGLNNHRPPPTSPRCPHNNLTFISVVPALGLPVPQHPCTNYPPTLFQPPPSPPSPHSLAGQCWASQEPNGLWRTGDSRCSWALSLQFPARAAEPHWTLPQPLTSAHCPTQHETASALSQA